MELERLLKKGEGIEALITIGVEPYCINTQNETMLLTRSMYIISGHAKIKFLDTDTRQSSSFIATEQERAIPLRSVHFNFGVVLYQHGLEITSTSFPSHWGQLDLFSTLIPLHTSSIWAWGKSRNLSTRSPSINPSGIFVLCSVPYER